MKKILLAGALLAAVSLAFAETGTTATGAADVSTGSAATGATAAVDVAPDFGATASGAGASETGALPVPTLYQAQATGAVALPVPKASQPAAVVTASAEPVAVPTLTHYMGKGDLNKEVQGLQAYLKSLGYYGGQVGVAYDDAFGKAINAYLLAKTKTAWADLEVGAKKYVALQKLLKAESVAQRWTAYKAKRDALYKEIDALNKARLANFQAKKGAFKAIDDERKAIIADYARKLAANKAKFQAAVKEQNAEKTGSQKDYAAILAKVKALDASYRSGK